MQRLTKQRQITDDREYKMGINVTRSSMPDFEEYCNEIRELWDSHWLTNMGKKHLELETGLKKYLEVPYITLFTNGHLALEDLIASFGFTKGSEIITTAFTFASTTHAIVRNGLTPVFCDINDSDYTLDESGLEELITDKTAAILPVHVYGNMCHVEAIDAVAERHGLKVIYDAAHTFGVRYRGMSAVSYGDAAILSFHATKVYNTIEGGAAVYHDGERKAVLDDLKNFGIRNPETCCYAGGNAKMNEFQAAMGICNLRHVDEEIAKRRSVCMRYYERLSEVKGIKLCSCDFDDNDQNRRNYAYLPVVFDGDGPDRDTVWEALKAHDITARKYFYPLTCDFECYRTYGFDKKYPLPVARRIAESVLTLPVYTDLALEDVDKICDILLKCV